MSTVQKLPAVAHDFAGDVTARQFVNGPALQSAVSLHASKINEAITGLDAITRSDGQLKDGITRLHSLHPEVAALIGSKAGWQPKADVQAASTVNINLAAPGATIDTRTMASGDRFLAKDQTAPAQNGVYVWNGASTPATRAADADTSADLGYAFVTVRVGSTGTQEGTSWVCNQSTDGIAAVGVTSITFGQVGGRLATVGVYPIGVGTEDRGNQHTYDTTRSALRCGASDTVSQDDERNYWRGLSSVGGASPGGTSNAWGTPALIGLFSVAFNRNGAAYGTYSATFGHDCITYGIASMAGGAGSCAGDPDAPTSPSFEGYCSLAWGKNCLASGSKAIALGEETKAQARASLAAGYASETAGQGGDTGTGSIALGYGAKANGNGAIAIGRDVVANASPYALLAAQIAAGGTGYTVSDILTIAGGTGTSATVQVSTVSGGVITAVSVVSYGAYTVKPSNPNSATGGTGTGASLTLFWVEGGIAIGRGANPGSPMVVPSGHMGLGVNTIVPTVELYPATDPSTDYGTVAVRGETALKSSVVTTGDDLTVATVTPFTSNSGGGGYGGVHFKALVAGVVTNGWKVDAGAVSGGICLYPHADNATRLGAASNRPTVLYAVTGTINTSDEREKQDIGDIPDAWLDAWAEVKFQRFHWRDAVATKGNGARWHVGVIAQLVLDAFARHGIDAMKIGVLCYDSWTDQDTGEARDRYGVRYEQALAMECALLRRRLDRLGG